MDQTLAVGGNVASGHVAGRRHDDRPQLPHTATRRDSHRHTVKAMGLYYEPMAYPMILQVYMYILESLCITGVFLYGQGRSIYNMY